MKIFAFDLDGTLLMDNNLVNEYTNNMLQKLAQQGHIIAIATGRGLQKVKPILKNFKAMHYAVCSNGAVIYDIKNDRYKVLNNLNVNYIDYLFELQNKYGWPLTIDSPQADFTTVKGDKGCFPSWVFETAKTMDGNLSRFESQKNVKKYFESNPGEIAKYAFRVKEEDALWLFNEAKSKINDAKIYITNRVYIDINPTGTSKYLGIEAIIKSLNLDNHSLVSFGDSDNDLEMIQNAYIGVAMGNATDNAKNAADIVIGDNNSDSIGKFLESFHE